MFEFDDPADNTPQQPSPQPIPTIPPLQPYMIQQTPPQQNGWLVFILVVVASVFAGLWLREKLGPFDPDIDPRPSGKAVGFFYNDEDFSKYTQDQRDVLNSTKVLDKLGTTPWIKIDEDDITTALDPVFTPLIDLHKPKLPCIVISTGRKLVSEELKTEDQVLELLEKNL